MVSWRDGNCIVLLNKLRLSFILMTQVYGTFNFTLYYFLILPSVTL